MEQSVKGYGRSRCRVFAQRRVETSLSNASEKRDRGREGERKDAMAGWRKAFLHVLLVYKPG